MSESPVDVVRLFVGAPGVAVTELSEAFELAIHRDGVDVVLTVPTEVLEWHVTAHEAATGRSVSDWCDYAGYDDTPEVELAEDMAHDIKTFVEHLVQRPFRLADASGMFRKRVTLQWQIEGEWKQAIPLLAEQPAAVDALKDARH